MGIVFEAEPQHSKRPIALKVVRGGQFVDEHQVRMFQREAGTLARRKHPNIGAIHESGCTDRPTRSGRGCTDRKEILLIAERASRSV